MSNPAEFFFFEVEHVFAQSFYNSGNALGTFLTGLGIPKNARTNMVGLFSHADAVADIQNSGNVSSPLLKLALAPGEATTLDRVYLIDEKDDLASRCRDLGADGFQTLHIRRTRRAEAAPRATRPSAPDPS